MSNRPNMSYCAFENTYRAILQTTDMLSDAIDDVKELNINKYEIGPFKKMTEIMGEFIALKEQYDRMFSEKKNKSG